MKDLNFVLRSEIFVHFDKQLRASHLILNCNPVYTTWQPFGSALLVDNPLLSYIDIRHANFLPPSLTVGEARDLGPKYITIEDLALVRDELVDLCLKIKESTCLLRSLKLQCKLLSRQQPSQYIPWDPNPIPAQKW